MRRSCAQAVDTVFTQSSSDASYFELRKFILNLYYQVVTGFNKLYSSFAHMISSLFIVVGDSFSTNSTSLITITTFYKKGLLTTHRGIN